MSKEPLMERGKELIQELKAIIKHCCTVMCILVCLALYHLHGMACLPFIPEAHLRTSLQNVYMFFFISHETPEYMHSSTLYLLAEIVTQNQAGCHPHAESTNH